MPYYARPKLGQPFPYPKHTALSFLEDSRLYDHPRSVFLPLHLFPLLHTHLDLFRTKAALGTFFLVGDLSPLCFLPLPPALPEAPHCPQKEKEPHKGYTWTTLSFRDVYRPIKHLKIQYSPLGQ